MSTFNGSKNWDTHNAILWLANYDAATYEVAREAAAESLTMEDFADVGQDLIEHMGNPDGIDYREIYWPEVYSAFFE